MFPLGICALRRIDSYIDVVTESCQFSSFTDQRHKVVTERNLKMRTVNKLQRAEFTRTEVRRNTTFSLKTAAPEDMTENAGTRKVLKQSDCNGLVLPRLFGIVSFLCN